ncbi:MAG: cation:proton antiporter [Phycisphaeraceae bacterium]|nr:cation:proton antiporter [Phycisphaeraceae bacterium]
MHSLPLLNTIAAAFAAAWVLGLITQRIGLSPIVGYLLAGVVIGPYTPGFVGDVDLAHQLAELGVILLMFGVGLHFHVKDLMAVKNIAIPGAVVQSAVATITGMIAFKMFGWPLRSGLVLGMSMAVASTVVLLRVLMDKDMLRSTHGQAAVGWLIVEDIFTVLALVIVPMMAMDTGSGVGGGVGGGGGGGGGGGLATIGWALAKLAVLVALVLLAGSRVVPFILGRVAKLRSRELFTLTVLVLSVAIAVASSEVFGASMALGAFLAGMVVAQSPASHQAAADALPLRDAFAVLFFVSVGMLFDPGFLVEHPLMVVVGLVIVLAAKPAAALLIVALLGYPARTALTVAIGLGQIGEFSFILAQVAGKHGLLPAEGQHVLIACAMISIAVNPIAFKTLDPIEAWCRRRPWIWKLLNGRADRRARELNQPATDAARSSGKPLAIIVGYGPVGRVVDALLRDAGFHTVIIELNMETVESLQKQGRSAIFGDASHPEVLEQAGIRQAVHLVVTLPHSAMRGELVLAAKQLNPAVEVTVRARYLAEHDALKVAGANAVVYEEGEAGIALARQVMERRGLDERTIDKMLESLRLIWGMKEAPEAKAPIADTGVRSLELRNEGPAA